MSESYGTGEQDEMGEFDVEENREDDEGEGYGASEQGDAGVEGPATKAAWVSSPMRTRTGLTEC
jgi:hypothetical protein